MTKTINITLDDKEHKALSKKKGDLNLTWEAALRRGLNGEE